MPNGTSSTLVSNAHLLRPIDKLAAQVVGWRPGEGKSPQQDPALAGMQSATRQYQEHRKRGVQDRATLEKAVDQIRLALGSFKRAVSRPSQTQSKLAEQAATLIKRWEECWPVDLSSSKPQVAAPDPIERLYAQGGTTRDRNFMLRVIEFSCGCVGRIKGAQLVLRDGNKSVRIANLEKQRKTIIIHTTTTTRYSTHSIANGVFRELRLPTAAPKPVSDPTDRDLAGR